MRKSHVHPSDAAHRYQVRTKDGILYETDDRHEAIRQLEAVALHENILEEPWLWDSLLCRRLTYHYPVWHTL